MSPLFTPLVDGSMASASAMVPLVKVEKKIAQISRVIQHLNAKSDDSDLDSLAGGRVERGEASVAATGQPRQLFARQRPQLASCRASIAGSVRRCTNLCSPLRLS